MTRLLKMAAALLGAAAAVGAADQVAVVTSSSQFHLRDAKVATGQGVPTWPVMAGDIVRAGDAPAAVRFNDGSSAVLDHGTMARVDRAGETPVLQLLCGTVRYSLKSLTAVKLMSENGPVTPAKTTGTFSGCNGRTGTGAAAGAGAGAAAAARTTWWTGGHTALFASSVGEGVAAWFGISAVINGGPCVSPYNCGNCAGCTACSGASR